MAFISTPFAKVSAKRASVSANRRALCMRSDADPVVSRRALLSGAVAVAVAAAMARARPANARIDYEGVGYLGGSDKVDIFFRFPMGVHFEGFTPLGHHTKQRVEWQSMGVMRRYKTRALAAASLLPFAVMALYFNWTNRPPPVGRLLPLTEQS